MSTYTQGDIVELPAEFRTAAGALIDPTTVKLRLVAPDGTAATYDYPGANIARTGAGIYLGTVDANQSGRYVYEWVLTGNVQGVEPADFYVEAALPANAAHRRVRARLASLVAATTEPKLGNDVLDELLEAARRPDADGVVPSDAAWLPTYDLDAAAADGWERKAGLATAGFDFSADGQSFSRQQVFDGCMRMAGLYRRGRGSARTSSGAVNDFAVAAAEGLVNSSVPVTIDDTV